MSQRIEFAVNTREKLVIGHRGAPNEAPENTLRGYAAAWELGADMIELDVQETKDGSLICIHDDDLSRTTSGKGTVSELNLVDIRGLDAGGGEKVPLLSEALDLAKGDFALDIEIKSKGIEERAFELVKEFDMLDSVLFSSFSESSVTALREITDEGFIGLIVHNPDVSTIDRLRDLEMDFIAPLFYQLSEELVSHAHEANLCVYPWTVNDEDYIREMLKWDVDGIISDIPDICAKIVDEHLEGF